MSNTLPSSPLASGALSSSSLPRRHFLGSTGLLLAAGAAGLAFGSSSVPGTTPRASAADGAQVGGTGSGGVRTSS